MSMGHGVPSTLLKGSAIENHQEKLSLMLRRQLAQAEPQHSFDILLTLIHEPRLHDLQVLKMCGLKMSDFHQQHPSRLLPGVITKQHLEKNLLLCPFISYIEGIVQPATPSESLMRS